MKYINQKGFTMIEMLIYVAIIGVVVASFVSFSLGIANSRDKAYVSQEVQGNARTALHLISQRIKAATGINVGASTFDTDPGVLSLIMADGAKDPTIISLDADDGVLQITEGTGDPVTITSDEVKVTNLVFTNLTPTGEKENVKAEMTLEFNSGDDVEFFYSQSLQTAVSLRQ